MLYAFERYKKSDLGYWLRSYIYDGANIERQHVLIDLTGTDFSTTAYYTDDWFKELMKDSKVKDYCGDTGGTVGIVHTSNSNFDNVMINRHAHKELQPDIQEAVNSMKKAGAPDAVINGFLRNYLKTVFEEKSESYRRMWHVINENYDPLYNVDVEDKEVHTGADTTTHTGTETLTNDGKDTKTTTGNIEDAKTGKETTKDGDNSQTTTNNSVFAFDSATPIDANKSETILETEKELSFDNRKDTRTYNNFKEEQGYDSTHETEYDTTHETEYDSTITRTKKGNQGVTMSQEMLEREISSWSTIDFLKYVVDDVARDMLIY